MLYPLIFYSLMFYLAAITTSGGKNGRASAPPIIISLTIVLEICENSGWEIKKTVSIPSPRI